MADADSGTDVKNEPLPEEEPSLEVQENGAKMESHVVADATMSDFEDDRPVLRNQQLALPDDLREQKPSASDVVVLSFGSYGIRYGFASDSTPRKVFPAVAFPRKPVGFPVNRSKSLCVPVHTPRSEEQLSAANELFEETREAVAETLVLNDRRRGGGRPIPWKSEVEPIVDDAWNDTSWLSEEAMWSFDRGEIIVGKDVQKLAQDPKRADKYDIVFPIWDGKVLFDCGAPTSLLRRALDEILTFIVRQLTQERKNGLHKKSARSLKAELNLNNGTASGQKPDILFAKDGMAKTFVTIVAPETAHRRDVSEIVDVVFKSRSLQAAAVFVHQSAVSCALGAGLGTCTVVDIGHSGTVVACVEDGIICGESRIHLKYGSFHIHKAFEMLLLKHGTLKDILVTNYKHYNKSTEVAVLDEYSWFVTRVAEQTGGFNVDENDTMKVSLIKGPSGRSIRVKLGVGLRTVPCYGLIYPALLKTARECQTMQKEIPERGLFEKNSEDDNFVSDIFNDLRRSGIATAAQPIALFANDRGQPAWQTVNAENASIVDAIIWSVARAVEIKRPDQQSRTPDHYKRYLNAVLLAGGGATIEGIAPALEARIKKGFLDAGVNISDVTVIDGAKGKGDEELAAAAAVLKGTDSEGALIDDTNTAHLPWKGGAVMVEAEALNEYWVYRDDWDVRNVRALREKAPFYW